MSWSGEFGSVLLVLGAVCSAWVHINTKVAALAADLEWIKWALRNNGFRTPDGLSKEKPCPTGERSTHSR